MYICIIQDSEKGVTYEEHGVSTILADFSARIRLFGKDFTNFTVVKFVTEKQNRGEDCDDTPSSKTYTVEKHFYKHKHIINNIACRLS